MEALLRLDGVHRVCSDCSEAPPSPNCIVHVCTAAKAGPLMPKLLVRWEVNILVEVLKKCMLMSGRQSHR